MTTTTNNKTIDEQLTFDDQVIEKIAGITASKVPGILSLDGNMFSELADKVTSGSNPTKGINADVGGKYWYRGGVNWVAIIVFAIGVAFFLGVHQLPIFVNTIGATFIDMCLSGILYYGIMLLVDRKEDELCY